MEHKLHQSQSVTIKLKSDLTEGLDLSNPKDVKLIWIGKFNCNKVTEQSGNSPNADKLFNLAKNKYWNFCTQVLISTAEKLMQVKPKFPFHCPHRKSEKLKSLGNTILKKKKISLKEVLPIYIQTESFWTNLFPSAYCSTIIGRAGQKQIICEYVINNPLLADLKLVIVLLHFVFDFHEFPEIQTIDTLLFANLKTSIRYLYSAGNFFSVL